MTNTDQLKVGDRVMLLPNIKKYSIITPFCIVKIDYIGFKFLRIITEEGRYFHPSIENIQPLPTKFDGWEEE